jgi:hypothetical protein
MKRSLVLLISLACLSGCVEGRDPLDCAVHSCSSNLVCGADHQCVGAQQAHALTISWTLNGVGPTPTEPGKCADIGLSVGFANTDGGFSLNLACSDGSLRIERLPLTYLNADVQAVPIAQIEPVIDERSDKIPSDAEASINVDLTIP